MGFKMIPKYHRLFHISALAVLLGITPATTAAPFPNDTRRILYNSDSGNAFGQRIADDMSVDQSLALIRDSIDELAAARVDTFSIVTSVQFLSRIGPSNVLEQMGKFHLGHSMAGWRRLDEANVDARQIMADRCHDHGMEFIPCIRMNDRHGGTRGKIIRDHPEWHLKGLSGGPAVDFAQAPVREMLLAYVEEVLGTVEVDGIEFDYMRWAHMFQPGEGAEHAHLLTDMTRKTRQLLDDAAQRRGRSRLILMVRVPQTFQECEYLGYDLKTWIQEELVDAVIPSDFFFIDFNTPVTEFVEMTKGTRCRIYPSISPVVGVGYESLHQNLENYRAAAHSFYAAGASGIEAYNYQYHWRPNPGHRNLWPSSLKYLTALGDPSGIADHDRHYLFFPLWPRAQQTSFIHDNRIRLDRTEDKPQGKQFFRLYEDLSDTQVSPLLRFKAVGLAHDESVWIDLNGTEVDRPYVETRRVGGQSKTIGKELPEYVQHTVRLDWEPATITQGENELRIRLNTGKATEGTIMIDDLEVYVYVRPRH